MKRKFHAPFLIFALVAGIVSCKKEEDVILNRLPYIEIESVSPLNTQQFVQKIVVNLSYDDQDGDIGFYNPDSLSLFVTDSRLAYADVYHVQPLAPTDQELHIFGILRIELPGPFILGTGNNETIRYRIQIRDRAGNLSNVVETPDITVTR